MNQSPATKGESVWLITEQRTQHALQTNTHRARGRGSSKRGADTIAENMVRGGEGKGGVRKGDQPIWIWRAKAVLATLATHYLLIT